MADHAHDQDENTPRDATACGKCKCPSFVEKAGHSKCDRDYCQHSYQQHTG